MPELSNNKKFPTFENKIGYFMECSIESDQRIQAKLAFKTFNDLNWVWLHVLCWYLFVVMIKLRDGYQMLAAICKMVDHNKQPVPRPVHCECSFVNTLQYHHWKLSFVTHFRHNNIFISGWLTILTAWPRQPRAFLTNNLLSQKYYLKSLFIYACLK